MRLKRRWGRWLALAAWAVLLLACASSVPATPTPLPAPPPPRIERDVPYCAPQGVPLLMDLYYPAPQEAPAPVAVWVHGGGWTAGDKGEGSGMDDIPELVARGYLVAAINYRLAPAAPFPAQIEDCKCAIRSLRAHADRYQLDPERIVAWGASSGGHLVALLGLADASAGWEVGEYAGYSSRVQAVVDMFGRTNLLAANARLGPTGAGRTVFGATIPGDPRLVAASPVHYLSPGAPPFLIIHGDSDASVPLTQSLELYARLRWARLPAELLIVRNCGHSFQVTGDTLSPSRAEITRRVADFFDRALQR